MNEFIPWEPVKLVDNNKEEKPKRKKVQLSPKEWWQKFEEYLKTNDEQILDLLSKQRYPSISSLISGLAFDYRHRLYLNNLCNHNSQTWLYDKKSLLKFFRYLYQQGFFIWIPSKNWDYVSQRIKAKYPWLSSSEMIVLQKEISKYEDVVKTKRKDSEELQEKSHKPTILTSDDLSQSRGQQLSLFTDLIKNSKKTNRCRICPHYNQPQVFGDIRYYDKQVDILFVGEAPHTEEVKEGKPFVGKSGQILRSILNSIDSNINWAIWNASLCQVLPKKKDLSKALKCCYRNLDNAIETLKPKVIVLLGGSAYEGLFQKSCEVSKLLGQQLKYKDKYLTLVTYHPAAALHNPAYKDIVINAIEACIKQAISILYLGQSLNLSIATQKPKWMKKYVEKGWKLVDIQDFEDRIVYVFKDNNGQRHIVDNKIDGKRPIFYYYKANSNNPIVAIKDCKLVLVHNKYEYQQGMYDDFGYHCDIPISTRHAMDYYLEAERHNLDQDYDLKIAYIDIEVLPQDRRTFPNEERADDPIVLISISTGDDIHTWYLENKTKRLNQEFKNLYTYSDERTMLIDFLKYVEKIDPDILTGWNVFFDLNYILTRCERLSIDYKSLISPIGVVHIDRNRRYVFIGGRIVIDMLQTYKQLTFERKSSYSLGNIAQEELGYGKVAYDGPLMLLYDNDPTLFIEYNRQDVQLLVDLENKLTYIYFLNQLRKLIKGTWLSLVSTSAQCDTMLVTYLEGRSLAAKRKTHHANQEVFKGAFVYQPKPGIREWVFDLDYASLYPNIIRTFNIGLETFYAFIPNESVVEKLLFGEYNEDKVPLILDPLHNDKISFMPKSEFDRLIKEKCLLTPNGCLYLRQSIKRSTMYDLLSMLLSERKKYKKLKAEAAKRGDNDAKQKYHVMQWTYKIIANSFYGYLGFEYSRIHDRRVAASVTSVGRFVIKTALAIAEQVLERIKNKKFSLDILGEIKNDNPSYKHVIYSDTDSIFCSLQELSEVITPKQFIDDGKLVNIEQDIDSGVREFLKQHFKLEECYFSLKNEWVARRLLQTSKKKRYAYITYPDGKLKITGIEVKRSDQPPIVKEWLSNIIKFILESDNLTTENIVELIRKFAEHYRTAIRDRNVEAGKPMAANFTKPNLPQCRAAQNWNKLMFEYFKTDTRGFYFHLHGIDMTHPKAPKYRGQIKDILVPPELSKVPEFFIINEEKMIEDYWIRKVEAILSDVIPAKFDIIKSQLSLRAIDLPTW